jgi:hypothetical protein
MRFLIVAAALAACLAGCTATSVYVYPQRVQERYLITTGDSDRPYRSMGYIQITKKGADILGFIPIVSADLEAMFGDELLHELERTGADGIINVRFYERQWTPLQRIGFLLTVVVWVPTYVELTGELIQFAPEGSDGAPGAAPSAPPAPSAPMPSAPPPPAAPPPAPGM